MIRYELELHDTATRHAPSEVADFKPYRLSNEKNLRSLYVLLCFSTPFVALTKDGLKTGKPGDCMIVSPSFHEYHGPADTMTDGFVNDWLHVIVHDEQSLEEDIGLPLNVLIPTGNTLFFRPYINAIDLAILKGSSLQDVQVSNLIESMMIALTEESRKFDLAHANTQWEERLTQVRQKMNSHIFQDWSVSRLAGETGLSISRFSVLYRQRFSISPMEDLIQMRLTNAKRLLLSTNLTLHEIAEQCGFQSESYFCRLFKSRFNVTPSEFRLR